MIKIKKHFKPLLTFPCCTLGKERRIDKACWAVGSHKHALPKTDSPPGELQVDCTGSQVEFYDEYEYCDPDYSIDEYI